MRSWTSSRRGSSPGNRKARNRGKLVAAFMMGTTRLYEFVHDNPMVEMRPVDFTNDTHVIRSLENMTAINSAIEVDLSGQVVADSIGYRMYSGVGGQMDFMRGAALAPGGRPIIALPSTAGKDGEQSRITPSLKEGAGVVTTRAHVHTVVTEWGVAELWGKSLRERAKALISIAHPDHRDLLASEARRHHELSCRACARERSRARGRPAPAGGAARGPETKQNPRRSRRGSEFGWVPGVPSGTHLACSLAAGPCIR